MTLLSDEKDTSISTGKSYQIYPWMVHPATEKIGKDA